MLNCNNVYKIHQTAPNFKILDCTIRDGGLVNDSNFDDETVRSVYEACAQSNIDIMEIGFRDSDKFFPRGKYGKWRFATTATWRKFWMEKKKSPYLNWPMLENATGGTFPKKKQAPLI